MFYPYPAVGQTDSPNYLLTKIIQAYLCVGSCMLQGCYITYEFHMSSTTYSFYLMPSLGLSVHLSRGPSVSGLGTLDDFFIFIGVQICILLTARQHHLSDCVKFIIQLYYLGSNPIRLLGCTQQVSLDVWDLSFYQFFWKKLT